MNNYNKKSVRDISVGGKRVLVRCDFNVPMKNGVITDDTRVTASLPTINYLIEQGAKVILCSHLGRPDGSGFQAEFSLLPVAKLLSEKLGKPVTMASDIVGDSAKTMADKLNDGEVMLLENVRFEKGETKNNRELSQQLSGLADIFVNDAFGTAHRAHSSTAGVAEFLPSVSGLLIAKELEIMGGALSDPKRPFVAILGGAKVSDKIGVIKNLLEKVDTVLIGGAMAYTFLTAKGEQVGNSKVESEHIATATELLSLAKEKNVSLLLPCDHVVADEFKADAKTTVVDSIPSGTMALDIGAKTVKIYSDIIGEAGTVIWNGPMGVFEMEAFSHGTNGVAKAVAGSGAVSIIGGGDSAAAVTAAGLADRITHISTGGGASLEFLEGITLPGIACLEDR